MDVSAHEQEHNEGADKEPAQCVRDSPETPKGSRKSRRSVRRSLLGKTSLTSRTSLAEKYSRAWKRESLIRKSSARTVVKSRAPQKLSVSSSGMNGKFGCHQISLFCAVPARFVEVLLSTHVGP